MKPEYVWVILGLPIFLLFAVAWICHTRKALKIEERKPTPPPLPKRSASGSSAKKGYNLPSRDRKVDMTRVAVEDWGAHTHHPISQPKKKSSIDDDYWTSPSRNNHSLGSTEYHGTYGSSSSYGDSGSSYSSSSSCSGSSDSGSSSSDSSSSSCSSD